MRDSNISVFMIVIAALICKGLAVSGSEAAAQVTAARPIQALLVTGGCCHDYDRQKRILTRGISARANVRWTVVQQGGKTTDTPIPLYHDPDWAQGFDIVVHNECFSNVKDTDFVDGILKPHRNGTPAILIHCAMHCYRVGDDRWFEFVGLQSPGHGPHYSYTAENLKPEHPIMQGFGPRFIAPKGELYHAVKIFDTATPLAQANRQSDGLPQVCVWTNDYHGTRVFGTTIGHYNETMAEPKYLDMLTRGLLWAVGRDAEKEFHPTTEQVDEEIRTLISAPVATSSTETANPENCCGQSNIAFDQPVTASSEQDGHPPGHLTDGDLNSRWCASGPQSPEWVAVDLEQPRHLRGLRLHWEFTENVTYRYLVEGSSDNARWETLVDASDNEEPGGIREHTIDAPETRYLKITFLGSNTGGWGSIWEVEVSEKKKLPKLSKLVTGTRGIGKVADVEAPDGFAVSLFGAPPEVNYPVCLTAAATGDVFVGVDEQGSLGKESGRGRVLRCLDTDGDGRADRINEFAKMDHPRGLIYDNGSLWVLHPPLLSVFHDSDGDGVAETSETLVTGISHEESLAQRGADHTTNGIRMGIDGWIYIAVGDFGVSHAEGSDGTVLSRRGGGVVRVRPDATDMEIYSWGQRNIVDVAIDPELNLFTRDNTNDGGGWDIRLSHILQTAHYGYPSLYKNFTEETMPPLADYGGGSGCGALYFQDARWPEGFNDLLLTCDWGRSEVYSHRLPAHGATFDAQQETFLKIPRPTDLDVDASGRMYVGSWKNGRFAYDGPNVGFVAMITPTDFVPHPVPEVGRLGHEALVELLEHPSDVMRLHVQRAVLRRGASLSDSDRETLVRRLQALSQDHSAQRPSRVAALFTLKQLQHAAANPFLMQLTEDPSVREFCLRALADRKSELENVPADFVAGFLNDADPRVQAAALIALGRIGDTSVATEILPLTERTEAPVETDADPWRVADPGRVLPHLAVQALVELRAIDVCLEAVEGAYRNGALWALRSLHDARTVDGLFQLVSQTHDSTIRRELWTTLIRLYHREGAFRSGWWGTRPDTSGPYYDRQTWSESERIAAAIRVALAEADESLASHLQEQLDRHVVRLQGITSEPVAPLPTETAITLPQADPDDPNQIANLAYEKIVERAMQAEGNADRGEQLFRQQACINCHTYANGQQPRGPHLVDIGKRYKKPELIESIVKPSAKIAQGFETWTFLLSSGKTQTGFVVLESAETVTIRETNGLAREFLQDDVEDRVKQEISMMPKGMAGNLTPEQLADLIAFLQSLH